MKEPSQSPWYLHQFLLLCNKCMYHHQHSRSHQHWFTMSHSNRSGVWAQGSWDLVCFRVSQDSQGSVCWGLTGEGPTSGLQGLAGCQTECLGFLLPVSWRCSWFFASVASQSQQGRHSSLKTSTPILRNVITHGTTHIHPCWQFHWLEEVAVPCMSSGRMPQGTDTRRWSKGDRFRVPVPERPPLGYRDNLYSSLRIFFVNSPSNCHWNTAGCFCY